MGSNIQPRGHREVRPRHLVLISLGSGARFHLDMVEVHTKVVCCQDLVLESMLGADGDNGLVGAQGFERLALPCGLSPEHLLFQDMEEGDDVSEAAGLVSATDHGVTIVYVWYVPLEGHIAISDRDHGDLEVLGRGTEGQEQCQDIIDTFIYC